ncbi:MAG: ATP-binding protein [Myxococcota bacterium]
MAAARVLVVEDEQIVALDLADRLMRLGYEVVGTSDNGAAAIELAGELLPDVILMDIRLRGEVDGVDAATQIRRQHDVPVVYLTAHGDPATVARAKATEPYGYLLKPFEQQDLQIALEMALVRHAASRRVRESQLWLEATLCAISDGIIAVGPDGRIRLANPAAAELTGWCPTEAVGRPVHEVLEIRPGQEPPEPGGRLPVVDMVVARDGRMLPVEHNQSTIHDDHGKVMGQVFVLRDMAERVRVGRAHRLLADASAQMASSLDPSTTLACAVAVVVPRVAEGCLIHRREPNGDLVLVAASHVVAEQACALTAQLGRVLKAEEPQGLPGRVGVSGKPEVVHVARTADVVTELLPGAVGTLLEPGARSLLGVPLVGSGRVSGVLTLVSERAEPRLDALDLAVAEVLASRISVALENARLYAEARRAIRMREEVLAVVSHDLRSPLSTVTMNADLLLRACSGDPAVDPDRLRRLRLILGGASEMSGMIEDLLDMASIDQGRPILQRGVCRGHELLLQMAERYAAAASCRRIRLEVADAVPDETLVFCDRQRALRVLANLVGNALKFTPPGGRVTLAVQRRGRDVQFSVADTGPGIAPDELPRVFDRFWRSASTRSTGMGLGLYIARGLVEAQGGRIWARSTTGAGSTFLFTLPAADGAPASTTATPPPA